MSTALKIIIERNGTVRHLVDDAHMALGAAFGERIDTWRNSHVESWSSLSWSARWCLLVTRRAPLAMLLPAVFRPRRCAPLYNAFWADMRPVGGPVLGPFQKHSDAIKAEVALLLAHSLPTRKT